ncbi:MAG: DNA-processing protein DprA [Christensenellales bacterium]
MNSKQAVKLYAMVKTGIIKSNAMFWRNFSTEEKIKDYNIGLSFYENELKEKNINLICVFDNEFPKIHIKLKNGENPFLFAYKGNVDLLKTINNNVAVIGTLTPTDDIEVREQKIVRRLVENDLTVVSGFARGCDTVAHVACLTSGGKTVAILPTTFEDIYPKENIELVDEIVNKSGLVVTEYFTEPQNKYERIKRFIERDRLQAVFSKTVILIASFRKGEGDSGSRHALQKAKEYGRKRFVMFNEKTDSDRAVFGLNRDLLNDNARILTERTIRGTND